MSGNEYMYLECRMLKFCLYHHNYILIQGPPRQSGFFKDSLTVRNINGILLPKLFWPTVRKKCSSDREKFWDY